MKVLSSPEDIYAQLDFARRQGKRIGLVPTMGALHDGHLSLVREAKRDCEIAVTTIFVNPSQFGPNEDFAKYPRTLDSDLEKLASVGCDFVFVPSKDHMYPLGHTTFVEPPAVATNWEGKIRPGHFRGVTTIVLKLFNMLPAHVAYFGRKDYQQVAVISAMVRDGLAMSSRNRYLSATERVRALGLRHALSKAQSMIDDGHRNVAQIESAMHDVLNKAPVDSIDYAAIVDPDTMEQRSDLDSPAVAIIAVRVGTTRLIDNSLLRIQ